MGYAIIKGGAREYALNRQVQNLTPIDSNYRKNLAANVVATYGSEIDGVYRVTSINLGEATQPYIYALVDSSGNDKAYTGVSINQFSGAITTSAGYTGEAVYVKVKPQIVANYYTTTAATSAFLAIQQHAVDTHTASLNSFTYTIDGGTGWPQSLTSSETTLTLTQLNITYDGNPVVISDLDNIPNELTNSAVTAVTGTSTNVAKTGSTLKQLIITRNTSTSSRSVKVTINAKYNGISISAERTIMQEGKTLESITFASYNGSASTPISVNNGETLAASSFKVNGTYDNGETASNLVATAISASQSSGFGSSITVSSSTTGVYLKYGDIVTNSAVSVSVSSQTLVWDSNPVTIPATALAYPYAESADPDTTTYKIASESTGQCAHIYDAVSHVRNNQLIFKIVGGLTDGVNNSCIVYSNNAYPTDQNNRTITVVDWEEKYSVLNQVETYNLPSTSASYLYLVIRSVASDSPQVLFGHYE